MHLVAGRLAGLLSISQKRLVMMPIVSAIMVKWMIFKLSSEMIYFQMNFPVQNLSRNIFASF
jgi:hypothetical protein